MIEVIGAGFGRTGTLSLKHALEILGFGPCHHMYELYGRPEDVREWIAACDGDTPDWRRLLEGFRATTDWPAAAFWRELHELFPRAKVILTTRPPERWVASLFDTIVPVVAATSDGNELVELSRKVVIERTLSGNPTREAALEAFDRHNRLVRETIPADLLLDFDVSEGWTPLCDFLGVPVPNRDFPHDNDRAFFRQLFGMEGGESILSA